MEDGATRGCRPSGARLSNLISLFLLVPVPGREFLLQAAVQPAFPCRSGPGASLNRGPLRGPLSVLRLAPHHHRTSFWEEYHPHTRVSSQCQFNSGGTSVLASVEREPKSLSIARLLQCSRYHWTAQSARIAAVVLLIDSFLATGVPHRVQGYLSTSHIGGNHSNSGLAGALAVDCRDSR